MSIEGCDLPHRARSRRTLCATTLLRRREHMCRHRERARLCAELRGQPLGETLLECDPVEATLGKLTDDRIAADEPCREVTCRDRLRDDANGLEPGIGKTCS